MLDSVLVQLALGVGARQVHILLQLRQLAEETLPLGFPVRSHHGLVPAVGRVAPFLRQTRWRAEDGTRSPGAPHGRGNKNEEMPFLLIFIFLSRLPTGE